MTMTQRRRSHRPGNDGIPRLHPPRPVARNWRTISCAEKIIFCIGVPLACIEVSILVLKAAGADTSKIPVLTSISLYHRLNKGLEDVTATEENTEDTRGSQTLGRALADELSATQAQVESFRKPAKCSRKIHKMIRNSGMEGTECKDSDPFDEKCAFTQLTTRGRKATWLDGFVEEVQDLRSVRSVDDVSFLGVVLDVDSSRCERFEDLIHAPSGAAAEASVALGGVLKRPKLLCSNPKETAATAKWGLIDRFTHIDAEDSDSGETLDSFIENAFIENAGMRGTVKDAVLIDLQGNGINAILGGQTTLSRTRYVEFEYHWKEAWAEKTLSETVKLLDDLAFTCYWAGSDGRLWRITDCFQQFYSYRSWSYVACSNRIFAPKLSERMENIFMSTIGNG